MVNSWLNHRTFQVKWSEEVLSTKTTEEGLPQGFRLLLNVFQRDNLTQILQLADDTDFMSTSRNIRSAQDKTETETFQEYDIN